jgi:hypothetical protein
MDVKCGERAIGARTILDNHRLTERGTELVGDEEDSNFQPNDY